MKFPCCNLLSIISQVSRFAKRGVDAPREEVLVQIEDKLRTVERLQERGFLGSLKVYLVKRCCRV